jgi:hypothetical protein
MENILPDNATIPLAAHYKAGIPSILDNTAEEVTEPVGNSPSQPAITCF